MYVYIYIYIYTRLLCSGILPQTADTTVKAWSVILPQMLSPAVRLEVAVWVASTTLEIHAFLKGQYELGALQGGGLGFVVESYACLCLCNQGWVSPCTATSMRSIVRPLMNFKSAAIPSQHWCYARPTYQRTVVPIN
jgi:hypothetical protein